MNDRPPSGAFEGADDLALDLTHEPDLGYVFYPNETPDHPGHPRLDIIIPEEPTGRHFDPLKAQFHVLSRAGDAEQITVHHPWSVGQYWRVCPGLIILSDRQGKRVEAYSFGGVLQILSKQDKTVCALSSSAPIFSLFTSLDLPMWIVCQVEVLLAQQEAQWRRQHHHDFKARLGEVEPRLIYACCLRALHEKGSHIHCGDQALDRQGVHFVKEEIAWMKERGEWPAPLPALDQLCVPD